LHSCETGKGESSFAQNISNSEIFENVLIVAPTQNIHVQTLNNDLNTSQEKGTYGEDGKKGYWNFFKNGKQVDAMKGDTKPLFTNPIKTNEKYEVKKEEN
jgi:hypothetical protein